MKRVSRDPLYSFRPGTCVLTIGPMLGGGLGREGTVVATCGFFLLTLDCVKNGMLKSL